MANYAVGAVLAADLRAAIRDGARRLDRRRPGLVRVGHGPHLPVRARAAGGRRLRELLGRPPDATALLAEIERARAGGAAGTIRR